MSEHRHLIRSASLITALTFLSRIFGYIRDQRQVFLLGTGLAADAFTIAFRIPNLLRRLVGEGAVSAAFIPVFSRYLAEDKRDDAWKFANSMLTVMTVLLSAIAILGIVFSPVLVRLFAWGYQDTPGKIELTSFLNRIIFPYIFFISLSALTMGMLNSFRKFAAPAFSPVLLNISIIAASFFAPWFSEPSVALAVGVVIGGVLQLAIQLPPLWKEGWRFRPRLDFGNPGVRRSGALMLPVVFGAGIVQVNVFVDSIFASFLGEGSVASIYYADRVMELVLGGYSIALATAILPLLSRQAAANRIDEMKRTLNFGVRLILFITIPAAIGLVALRQPIIEVLFQYGEFDAQSTALTTWALLFFAVGLPAFSLVKIVVPAFYALQDTKTPVKIAFMAMFLNAGLNLLFFRPLENGAPPLATTLSALFNTLWLMAIFHRRHGSYDVHGIVVSFLKFASAALVLFMVTTILIHWPGFYFGQPLAQRIVALAVTIAAGAAAYFGAVYLFGAREITELLEILRGRRPRVEVASEQPGMD
jgi:putative peptidoglycan lipid II flippase